MTVLVLPDVIPAMTRVAGSRRSKQVHSQQSNFSLGFFQLKFSFSINLPVLVSDLNRGYFFQIFCQFQFQLTE